MFLQNHNATEGLSNLKWHLLVCMVSCTGLCPLSVHPHTAYGVISVVFELRCRCETALFWQSVIEMSFGGGDIVCCLQSFCGLMYAGQNEWANGM